MSRTAPGWEDIINVKDAGAQGDGVTDDTAIITMCIGQAAHGGIVFFPPGVYISRPQTLQSNVFFQGAGVGASVIKLKDGSNADLFSAFTANINVAAASGSGSNTCIYNWGFADITLDGNKANQTGGTSWCIRAYSMGYRLVNVDMQYGYSGNFLNDFHGSQPYQGLQTWASTEVYNSAYEGGLGINVGSYNSGGDGIALAGPTDSKWSNTLVGGHHGNCLHVYPNGGACQFANSHFWYSGDTGLVASSALVEADNCQFTGCEAEGSNYAHVVFLGGVNSWVGGRIFDGGNGHAGTGLQIGQAAGQTPFVNQVFQAAGVTTAKSSSASSVNVLLYNLTHPGINFANDGGVNTIVATLYQFSSSYFIGTPLLSTSLLITGSGLTTDGTPGKGGVFVHNSQAYQGFCINTLNGNPVFFCDTNGRTTNIFNSPLQGLNGSFVTTWSIDAGGNITTPGRIALGQSATTPDPGAGGTITTASTGVARVTPAASRAGVILQAGTAAGQRCTVVNNSASFTITFAAAATSHVADGAADVIAASSAATYTWDSVAALWYRG